MNWLIKFFGGKIVLGLSKATIMSIIDTLIITAKVGIVTSYITIALFIFNKFYDLLSNINTLVSSPSTDTVAWSLQVVVAMGVWGAFVDAWSLYGSIIITMAILFLSKKSLTVLNSLHQWAEDVTRINYI